MKKLIAILACIVVISGCTAKAPKEQKGTAQSDAVDGSYVIVDVTLLDGKVTEITIDETFKTADGTETTKKTLGAEYGLKEKSDIQKEWNEQVEGLESYIVANGIDAVKVVDKYATDDLKTTVSITIDTFVDTAKAAIENAKTQK